MTKHFINLSDIHSSTFNVGRSLVSFPIRPAVFLAGGRAREILPVAKLVTDFLPLFWTASLQSMPNAYYSSLIDGIVILLYK